MSLHHGLRSAAGASVADPYFANTSLLLLGNGTNGGQNNTFVDGSSNAFSVTRYGNTTQGTFSPFGYNWSNYFDGSGDYLSLSASAISGVGSSNFSIECWVFATRQTNTYAQGLVSYGIAGSVTGTSFLSFQLSASGYLAVAYATGSSLTLTDTTLFPINQWVHAVVCRSGSTLSLFVNGTRVATATTSATVGNSGDTLSVGGQWYDTTAGRQLQGYIANARIVNGSSAYDATQSSLTVPTAPLTAITNTSLLTCQSNRFLDNSSNAFTITPYGNAAVTNFAPFPTNTEYSTGVNGGSGYFDGSGDYLDTAYNSAFSLGTEFTIEAWVYFPSTPSSNATRIIGLGDGASGSTTYTAWSLRCESGGLSFYRYDGTEYTYSSSSNLTIGAWNHVCVVRNSSNNFAIFLNGTRTYSGTVSQSFGNVNTNALFIGRMLAGGGPTAYYLNGYISNIRVVKGTAVYDPTQTTLTVPSSPLTAITNTSLLLNFTNASIIDSTGKNDLETVGDAQISTSVKKFGTGSIYLDGNGDYLSIPYSSAFDFGTGDFTIEAWVYLTASPVAGSCILGSLTTDGTDFQWRTSTTIALGSNANAWRFTSNTTTFSLNTWFHIAVSRSSGTAYMWLNGSSIGSGAETTSFNAQSGAILIGRSSDGYFAGGYIDDLRITKGVARYTAAFTPPSRQLPAR